MKTLMRFLFLPLFLSGCIINHLSLFPGIEPLKEIVVEGSGHEKILIIDLSGVISEETNRGGGGIGGGAPETGMIEQIKEELLMAERDKDVRAVLLRINSPGGTVTASDLIYHEVVQFKQKTGKKVIASIAGIGASGAYYIASAADQIVAHPTAITGSIGVITLHLNLQGLLEKIGVGAEAIKSGPQKDTGSPFREMTAEDRRILQGMIDTLQARFLSVVAQGRKMIHQEQMKIISDGRIFTTDEAKEFGLIDQIGYIDSAIELAKQTAGIKEARIILYRRPSQYANNVYSLAAIQPNLFTGDSATGDVIPIAKELLQGRSLNFFYLWMP
ncbi:MAG: signal peptide peptidase SppA [Nitrospirae bacterium]|nr:signal peptide peptidase SppA [Candidatus Troglogloeales bacterium]